MRVLISGGCKQGKSTLAQRIAAFQGPERVYLATMRARDAEDHARILRHQRERAGMGFETVECASRMRQLIGQFSASTSLLLDSTTALLAEEMFGGDRDRVDLAASARVANDLVALMAHQPRIVIVSDAIYADGIRYDGWTEEYRRGLASIDRALAIRCDVVLEVLCGQRIVHKGDGYVAKWLEAACAWVPDGDGPVYSAAGLNTVGG